MKLATYITAAFLAALDQRTCPLIILHCLAKLGATGALGSFK